MQIFKNPNFDFVGYRWHAIALSAVVIVAGLITVALRGFPLGVEFSGGTIVIVAVRPGARRRPHPVGGRPRGRRRRRQNLVVQRYGEEAQRQIMIRLPQVGAEQGARARPGGRPGGAGAHRGRTRQVHVVEGTEIVGPMVGART